MNGIAVLILILCGLITYGASESRTVTRGVPVSADDPVEAAPAPKHDQIAEIIEREEAEPVKISQPVKVSNSTPLEDAGDTGSSLLGAFRVLLGVVVTPVGIVTDAITLGNTHVTRAGLDSIGDGFDQMTGG